MRRQHIGDLVNALCYTVFLATYSYMLVSAPQAAPQAGSRRVVATFALTTFFAWAAWQKQSKVCSALGFLSMLASIACMNLTGWPHHGEPTVLPQHGWTLMILSANFLDPVLTGALSVASLANAAAIVHFHPHPSSDLGETLPYLLLVAGVHSVVNYFVQAVVVNRNLKVWRLRAGYVLLGTSFALNCIYELHVMTKDPSRLVASGFNILRAGCFVALGFVVATIHALEAELTKEYAESEVRLADERSRRNACERERAERQAAASKLLADREALASRVKTETMQALNHELRTPLHSILGITSSLLSDLPSDTAPEQRQLLMTVMASSRLLLTLINNMLDMRKLEINMAETLDVGAVPLVRCLRESIEFCAAFAAVNEVKLDVHVNKALQEPFVTANQLKLQQIMINLLSNAIKYSRKSVAVDVLYRGATYSEALEEAKNSLCSSGVPPEDWEATSADREGLDAPQHQVEVEAAGAGLSCAATPNPAAHVIIVTVRDRGVGLPVAESLNVFQQFAQLSNCKDAAKSIGQPSGTGLGLSLCSQMVGRMGGAIWANNVVSGAAGEEDAAGGAAQSDEVVGAAFSFFLPQCASPVAAESPLLSLAPAADVPLATPRETAEALEEAKRSRKVMLSGLRVLVVDDALVNLKAMGRILRRLDVTSEACSSGAEALELLKLQAHTKQPEVFDIVLTDLQMPSMNGIELCRKIHELDLEEWQRPLVLGLTANTATATLELCIEAGMDQVLYKPVSPEELGRALEKYCVARATAAAAAAAAAADIDLPLEVSLTRHGLSQAEEREGSGSACSFPSGTTMSGESLHLEQRQQRQHWRRRLAHLTRRKSLEAKSRPRSSSAADAAGETRDFAHAGPVKTIDDSPTGSGIHRSLWSRAKAVF